MKYVDLEHMPRRNLFNLYKNMDFPFIGFTANIDVTKIHKMCKDKNFSFFKVFMYLVSSTCNSIKEFRYRFYENSVVEFKMIHPSYTLMIEGDAFNFCTVLFKNDFTEFYRDAVAKAEDLKGNLNINHEEERDDLIFISCVPWITFTQALHPMNASKTDAIPRVAWGKYFLNDNQLLMPVNVQANHAFVDGFHIGLFYKNLETNISKFINANF